MYTFHGLVASTWRDRRVLLAGGLLGLAVAFKLFGVLVVLGVVLGLLPRWRQMLHCCLGVVAGFALPTLPLAVLDPSRFVHDVVVAQLGRADRGRGPGLHDRLSVVLGLDTVAAPSDRGAWVLAALVAVTIANLVATAFRFMLLRTWVFKP